MRQDLSEPSQPASPHPASSVSLVNANFGNANVFEKVLLDWFEFLGARPGEVVVLEAGSDRQTHDVMYDLLCRGLIDNLQLIRPGHGDSSRNTAHIREHNVVAVATKPYVLFWKSDSLPFRRGHDGWLAEALQHHERPDTFAVGGSFNMPSRHHDAFPGYYFSDKCSENFALMKRETFIKAIEEFCGEYVISGFRTTNPAALTGQDRFLIEVAFERYMERHKLFTLTRVEDESWTIFHTNASGLRLEALREKYRRREDIAHYMNAANPIKLDGGCYYGRRRDYVREAKVTLGRWRRIAVSKLTGKPTGLPDHPSAMKGAFR